MIFKASGADRGTAKEKKGAAGEAGALVALFSYRNGGTSETWWVFLGISTIRVLEKGCAGGEDAVVWKLGGVFQW